MVKGRTAKLYGINEGFGMLFLAARGNGNVLGRSLPAFWRLKY